MERKGKKTKSEGIPKQSSKPREDWEFKLLKRIGNRIKVDLVNKGLPVDRLAIESETSRGSVRRILAGEGNIGVVTLDRIARALGYSDVVEFFAKLKV